VGEVEGLEELVGEERELGGGVVCGSGKCVGGRWREVLERSLRGVGVRRTLRELLK